MGGITMKRYDSYKDSGIEWIGEIPSHWTTENGKYLLNILPGYPADSNLFVKEDYGFPLIRIRDINSDSTEVNYIGAVPQEYVITKDDILVGMDGDFNIAKWKGSDALLNQRVCRVDGTKRYLESYAFFVLPNLLKRINDVTYATTVKHLSTYDITNSKLPVPPLSEQQAIAEYLDNKCNKIDEAIAKRQRCIELLEELKQSVITQTVTRGLDPNVPLKHSGIDWIGEIPTHWKITRVKDQFILKTGTTPKGFDKPIIDNEINWFTPSDISSFGTILNSAERKLSEKIMKDEGLVTFPKGSLIFVGIGATAGKLGFAQIEGFSNQQITGLIPKNCFSKFYFYYLCQDSKRIRDNASFTTLPIINNSYLSQVYWVTPPLSEQQAIADYLDKKCAEIDSKITKEKRKIELLQELKQSIITEVVTGKRKVV